MIAILRDITSGIRDVDYCEPRVRIPPTIVYLETLEVMWATGPELLSEPLPFMPPDALGRHIDTGSPWHGYSFVPKEGVPMSKALTDVHPFRGECAGAPELAILLGCLQAHGPVATVALEAHFGTPFIGAW